jgi:N-acetylmuramoyl-L-alanine amidase
MPLQVPQNISEGKQAYTKIHWRSTPPFVPPLLVFFLTLLVSGVASGVGAVALASVLEDIRFRSARQETRVTIEMDSAVSYEMGRLSRPNRLYIDLPKTRLAPDWERQSVQVGDGRLGAIRIVQNQSDQVRIVLELQAFGDYRVYTLPRPYRIIIDLQGDETAPSNRGKTSATPPARPQAELPTTSAPLTIVIDPGHGGKDPGAIGPGGLAEKTVALQIAKELQQVIRQALPHYRVVLTRHNDVFVPLAQRAKLANTHQAQLFISIHANSSNQRQTSGIETWYLSFAANVRAKKAAARENAMSEGQLSDLGRILRDLHNTDRINQSAVLAEMTHTALVRHMAAHYDGIINRGVDGAPFLVLLHTSMPSILVEVSFMSNLQDEARLRSSSYQRALAQGIFQGVRRFLQDAVIASQ